MLDLSPRARRDFSEKIYPEAKKMHPIDGCTQNGAGNKQVRCNKGRRPFFYIFFAELRQLKLNKKAEKFEKRFRRGGTKALRFVFLKKKKTVAN